MATPYMNLTLPEVLTTASPTWATQLNSALETISEHDHTLDKGTQVPVAGLLINDDFDLNEQDLTNVNQLILNDLDSATTTQKSLSVYGGELHFVDGSGNDVQVTIGGAVNVASVGGITGLTGGGSITYNEVTGIYDGKFSFKCETNGYAHMHCSDLVIYERAAEIIEAVTLKSPSGLVAAYSLTLPEALPASTLPIVCSSAGVLSASASLTLTGLTLSTGAAANKILKSDGSGVASWTDSPDISSLETDSLKVVTGASTDYLLKSDASGNLSYFAGAKGLQISDPSGTDSYNTLSTFHDVNNLSVTITTTGRPVMIILQTDGSANGGFLAITATGFSNDTAGAFRIIRDTTEIARTEVKDLEASINGQHRWPASLCHIDDVAAGEHTYKFQSYLTAGASVEVYYCKLIAFEL